MPFEDGELAERLSDHDERAYQQDRKERDRDLGLKLGIWDEPTPPAGKSAPKAGPNK